jgi:hypothetical protein
MAKSICKKTTNACPRLSKNGVVLARRAESRSSTLFEPVTAERVEW